MLGDYWDIGVDRTGLLFWGEGRSGSAGWLGLCRFLRGGALLGRKVIREIKENREWVTDQRLI